MGKKAEGLRRRIEPGQKWQYIGSGISRLATGTEYTVQGSDKQKTPSFQVLIKGPGGGGGGGAKARLEKTGKKVIILGVAHPSDRFKPIPGEVIGLIALQDTLKKETKDCIQELIAKGIEPWILTGESQLTAEALGQEMGISPENVLSDVLPTQKAIVLRELKKLRV